MGNYFNPTESEIIRYKEDFIKLYQTEFNQFVENKMTLEYRKTLTANQLILFDNFYHLEMVFNDIKKRNNLRPVKLAGNFELMELIYKYLENVLLLSNTGNEEYRNIANNFESKIINQCNVH